MICFELYNVSLSVPIQFVKSNLKVYPNECTLYSRHAQHTARGPNVARHSFQSGPQSPNLSTFCLILDVNNMYNRKNLTNLARK